MDTRAMISYSNSLIFFTGIFVITYVVMKMFTAQPKKRLPPSMRSVPIVGSMPFLTTLAKLPNFFQDTSKDIGPVFSLKLGSVYTVVLSSKETIEEAFVKHSLPFAGRHLGYTHMNFLNVGRNGITAKHYGEKFRKYHKLTLSILREFGFGSALMEQRIMTEADELVQLIKNHNGQPFYPAQLLSMAALNVISGILFGERLSQTDKKLNELAETLHTGLTSDVRKIDYCPILRFLPRFKKLLREAFEIQDNYMQFIQVGIETSLKSGEESFSKRFVQREGQEYEKDELRFILRDLLLAGSETTASSLQWALVLLANNQDIQNRVHKEIDSVIPRSRSVSLDDAAALKYVEAAILELQRIKTVVPFALPHTTLEDTEVGGYFIPKNTSIIPNFYSVHMCPEDWPEPELYRPERFIDDSGTVFGKDRIRPFSIGKRSCLGEFLARQELFLFFTTLIQRFHILPPDGQEKVECTENFVVTMCPTPFKIRMISRDT
jgi:cytochrome P450